MAAEDLTTLASVREHLQISDAADTDQDAVIGTMITAASNSIQDYLQRQIAPTETAATHTFRYNGRGVLPLAPYDASSVTSVVLDSDTDNPVTLTSTQYRAMPLDDKYGVFHTVHLLNISGAVSVSPMHPQLRAVAITGNWGFASIPSAVVTAANITAAYLLRTTSQFMGDEMGMDSGFGGSKVLIPGSAKALLAPYKRRSTGA